jgi:hypothetical protein
MSEKRKPGKSYSALGPTVTVKTKHLENDEWAQRMLREVGTTMAEEGFTYLGSAAIHFYSSGDTVLSTTKEGAVKHQLCMGEIAEKFAQFGLTEFTRAIMRFYGHVQKRIDPSYKVEL